MTTIAAKTIFVVVFMGDAPAVCQRYKSREANTSHVIISGAQKSHVVRSGMRKRRHDEYDDYPPKRRRWLSAIDWQAIIGGLVIWAGIAAAVIWAQG